MEISTEAHKILQESSNQTELLAVIEAAKEQLRKNKITPTSLQWTILVNHLNEMIKRSKAGEKMPEVDPEMFQEVSADALDIARSLTNQIGNLPEAEIYVLSIHFESAKQN